jgi:hypothetical protein
MRGCMCRLCAHSRDTDDGTDRQVDMHTPFVLVIQYRAPSCSGTASAPTTAPLSTDSDR